MQSFFGLALESLRSHGGKVKFATSEEKIGILEKRYTKNTVGSSRKT
jgi:hypothetical protein